MIKNRPGTMTNLLLLIAVFTASCSILTRETDFSNWFFAMSRGEFHEAEQLTDTTLFPDWKETTHTISQKHGDIESFQMSTFGLPPPNSDKNPINIIHITWEDKTQYCLRAQAQPDGIIKLHDSMYQDCAVLSQDNQPALPKSPYQR